MSTKTGVIVEEVREVTDELVEAWGHLLQQLSSSAPPLTREMLEEIVASPTTFLLIARAGAEIVGSLTLAVFRIPTGVRAWIEDVVVDEATRGNGVGEHLIRTATELAQHQGCRTVDLTSRPSREAANRLYKRVGFEVRETNVYRYTS